jgi:MarR family transcriptional regulator for hemolysin
LARTAKLVSRAFENELATEGGSLPTWLVLVSLKSREWSTQGEIAGAIGIEGATLTHHLNRMVEDGLVTRTPDPENRRAQRVELTEAGNEAFLRMRGAAMRFHKRLRQGISDEEVTALRGLMEKLQANVAGD